MALVLSNVHIGAHSVSKVHKNCRPASTGVSEATSLPRCHSPPGLGLPSQKVWPSAIIPPGNTVDYLNTLLLMSPDGKGQSPSLLLPVHFVLSSTDTVCIVSAHGATAMCCLLEGGQLGAGKCHTLSCSFSLKEIDFCMPFGVRCWAAALCQPMVLLGGKLIAGW